MRIDAVFEGSGVKGVGLVGALHVFEKKGFRWNRLAGSSSGALIASLLAAGYRSDEIKSIIIDFSLENFTKPSTFVQKIPVIGKYVSLIRHNGMYSSDPLETYIAELLSKKGVRTFSDLPEHKLKITASDITLGRLLVLPDDLVKYGMEPQKFSVAKAVRMSASLPFYFSPTILPNKENNQYSYIVDGALLSNYPIWVLNDDSRNNADPCPIFGFRMISKNYGKPFEVSGPVSYIQALISTMMEAHDMRYLEQHDKLRSILVSSLDVNTTEFDLTLEKKLELYETGIRSAAKFLNKWTLDEHMTQQKKSRSVKS
jgi:NTE family protein